MRICIVYPATGGAGAGNRITALRWARLLRELGHRVRSLPDRHDGGADLLVALHARRSEPAAAAFRERHPDRPVVVALTGTDLYRDLPRSRAARRSLALADRLVVLQRRALLRLPAPARRKARVIHQSVRIPNARAAARPPRVFEVAVVGHLRPVKDPFRVAYAVRDLPSDSRVRVTHVGAALGPELARRARAEMRRNRRYRWIGERSHPATLRLLARS